MEQTKKITRATFKSFIKKNEGKIYIKVKSSFDGMIDGISYDYEDIFKPLEHSTRIDKGTVVNHVSANNLGYDGIWLVLSSRDYFTIYEDSKYIGIEVYNCCGSFIVVIEKEIII